MSPGLPPLVAATDMKDLIGIVVFVLIVLGQVLRPGQKKPGAPKPAAPTPSSDTSRNAPAAEPMAEQERPTPRSAGSYEGTSRNAPAAEPMTPPERARAPTPSRAARRAPAPAPARARLTHQAPVEGLHTAEARRREADPMGLALPTAEDMPGAHSAAHGEHLADLETTSLKSNRHPGMAPTAAAAPKQRQFVNRGRALLGSGLEGRDRLRGAFAWTVVLGSPKAKTYGRPAARP